MPLPFSLPVQRNCNFVGRQSLLKKLHEHLSEAPGLESTSGGQSRIVVLYGLGGAGKTQLSTAYAYSHRDEFDAVLWVDGANEANTLMSYRTIAQRFLDATRRAADDDDRDRTSLFSKLSVGCPSLLSPSGKVSINAEALPKIARAVIEFLQSDAERFTWLLIVDNVDNLTGYPLSSFLPQSKRGSIIITTRLTAVSRFGYPIEVGEIEEESAVQILLSAARLRFKFGSDDTKELANALGFLPLALEQAGAYINKAQMPLRGYLQLLEKNRRELLRTTEGLGTGSQVPVFATWELSFERLEKEDATAAELLTVLAFLHRSSFWEGLFSVPFPSSAAYNDSGRDDEFSWLWDLSRNELRLTNAMGKIFSVSLAKRNSRDGNVYIHPLVHAWGRERLSTAARRQKLVEAIVVVGGALDRVYNADRATNKNAHDLLPRALPHAEHCVEPLDQEGAKDVFSMIFHHRYATTALFYIGVLFKDNARLQKAEEIFAAIVAQQDSALSTCTPLLVANSQRHLGQVLTLFSRYKESEAILAESVASLTRLAGSHHSDTLTALFKLGVVHHRCFRYGEAERLLREVMENDVKGSTGAMGRLGREAASILGLVYRHLGRHQDALELLERVITQASAATNDDGGATHLVTLKYRRALILQELGHWNVALQDYLDVRRDFKAALGPGHPLTLRTTNALGMLYRLLGRYREARNMLDMAWQGQEALGFSRERETAQLRTLFNVGVLNREEGLYREAHECLGRALAAERGLHGPHAHSTLRCQLELAVLEAARGELEPAVVALREVLAIQLANYPDGRTDQAHTRTALAETLIRLGLDDQAADALAPALSFVRDTLQPENPVRLKVELANATNLAASGRTRDMKPSLGELFLGVLNECHKPEDKLSAKGSICVQVQGRVFKDR
ncbi:Kinesin light chain 4 [Madurella mycetomatis]|uniref:Kinesin light chain 4 n=1 Tax=Madurella mycetomatis TaxID=100816 RepID=A0A175VW63_9PEZI|nr:Kinesin light chain 4 [Madurella mycetomatis]